MTKEQVIPLSSSYALGKRKTSIAKVILKPGTGNITINKKDSNIFFDNVGDERKILKKPLLLVNAKDLYDVFVEVKGGGTNSQLDAICLGISKALSLISPEFRKNLNKNRLLRRDSRIKERRKYGLKKARKASQYSKR